MSFFLLRILIPSRGKAAERCVESDATDDCEAKTGGQTAQPAWSIKG